MFLVFFFTLTRPTVHYRNIEMWNFLVSVGDYSNCGKKFVCTIFFAARAYTRNFWTNGFRKQQFSYQRVPLPNCRRWVTKFEGKKYDFTYFLLEKLYFWKKNDRPMDILSFTGGAVLGRSRRVILDFLLWICDFFEVNAPKLLVNCYGAAWLSKCRWTKM